MHMNRKLSTVLPLLIPLPKNVLSQKILGITLPSILGYQFFGEGELIEVIRYMAFAIPITFYGFR